MSEKQFKIVGLGEVLWDVLPTGKQLGGAPANFAYISNRLGNHGIVASRVGTDEDGNEIIEKLNAVGVDVSRIQKDSEHATGMVEVALQNGQPSYRITENVAWDFLEFSEDWKELAKSCDAVCFGTLAQRNSVSRNTIQDFLNQTNPECLRIFDVNLRQNYFSPPILLQSLKLANVLKLNHEELPGIVDLFEIYGADEIEKVKNLRAKFDLHLVCLTRGGGGSLLIGENEISEHSGIRVEIADTIGAGDAFTATLAHGILHGWNLAEINEKANRIGAFVASQTGAMPEFLPKL
jgi:fructokinase